MLTRRSILLAIAAATLADRVQAADASALAFVTAIYNSYKGKDSKGTSLDNARVIRRYFEPGLAALMVKDQNAAKKRDEVGILDFDPFIDAQDWQIASFDIIVSDATAGKTNATVKFKNGPDPATVVLDLVSVANEWRISDITWQTDGKTETLRKLYVP